MKSSRLHINTLLLIGAFTFGGVFITGCQKDKIEAKSIEQIRKEEGVPVKVTTLSEVNFDKDFTFFAKLSGIKEAVQTSTIGDKITKINAQVGSSVSEGKVIVEFPKDNPTIQYDQAKLAYDNSKKLYDRMKELLKAGETAQQNFDNAETQFMVNKRNFESVKQMIAIETPISGTIVDIYVKEGQRVAPGDNLFAVAQMNKIIAKVWVSESEIPYIRQGMEAEINWNNKVYVGKITLVALAIDPMTKAFGVEITFDNAKKELKSGITTEVKIRAYNNPKALTIARKLINKEAGKKFVYIIEDGKAVKKEITTGVESGINIEILSGIKQGDILVTEGTGLLNDGTKVKIIK